MTLPPVPKKLPPVPSALPKLPPVPRAVTPWFEKHFADYRAGRAPLLPPPPRPEIGW